MLTNTVRRAARVQVRLFSSFPDVNNNTNNNKQERREIHSTAHREADAAPTTSDVMETAEPSTLMDRYTTTAEVTVSKIFPAGFGWQSSSIIASNFGFAPETLNFALTTGTGDAIGVLVGHMSYYAVKKAAYDSDIDLTQQLHTGILLGSAAFCSGTAWQPLVNAFQGANLTFAQVFVGTSIGCGAAFYGGLRLGRTLLAGRLQHIEEPTYENSKDDASLSVAIGGATGFFVGTDAAYLPDQNFLLDLVGIQDNVPALKGCAIAGTSTAMGFMTAQSAMNLAYPSGKCWND